MKQLKAFGLLAALALSGCIGARPAEVQDQPGTTATSPAVPILPQKIQETKSVTGGHDPFSGTAFECNVPTSSCHAYPFKLVGTNATLTAVLTWTVLVNDFDLDLLDETGSSIERREAAAPGTQEGIEARIGPGNYTLLVQVWLAGPDTFTLSAEFAPA